MSDLLKVYNPYEEIDHNRFFTYYFDVLPSNITLEIPLKESKENIEKVIDFLRLEEKEYNVVLKNWRTKDASNSEVDSDFVYEYVFKSNIDKSAIFISLQDDTLKVEFLYDCSNKKIETKVLEINHSIRVAFGLNETPTFKVLIKNHSHFSTEDVRSQQTTIDLDKNYNDDFKEIHTSIVDSFESNDSGIILLHGKPGTGKTTYIKSLITGFRGQNFIFIQNEFVSNLLDPDFISFLLKQRNTILIIEDAEKVISSRESEKQGSVVSTVLQLTDGLFSDYLNIKVICTFNTNLSKVDTALLRKGRMIAMYEFKPLSNEKTNKLLHSLAQEQTEKELTVSDIYNFNQKGFIKEVSKNKIGF